MMTKMFLIMVAVGLLLVASVAGAQGLRQELERAEKVKLLKETLDRFGKVDVELQRLEKLFLEQEMLAKIVELRKSGLEALLVLKEMNSTRQFQTGEAERLRFLRDFLGEFELVLAKVRRELAPEH